MSIYKISHDRKQQQLLTKENHDANLLACDNATSDDNMHYKKAGQLINELIKQGKFLT